MNLKKQMKLKADALKKPNLKKKDYKTEEKVLKHRSGGGGE
jgi:ribosomal protein L32